MEFSYDFVLKNCIFISKKNSIFLKGLQVDILNLSKNYKEGDKFYQNKGLFLGLSNIDGDILLESKTCEFTDFEIYDRLGNEISDVDLIEYKKATLRDIKINDIINEESHKKGWWS